MAIVNKPNTFSSNTTISSSEVNSNFDTLYNEFNGSISAANLADDAVTSAKIADDSIDTLNVKDGAITGAKITNYKVVRQNDTTNTTESTARILTGWGWMQNTTGIGAGQLTETVTFGTAFAGIPIVLLTYGGDAGNVAPSYGTGGGVAFGGSHAKASNITATNFSATLTFDGTLPNNSTVYYQWIAIGV